MINTFDRQVNLRIFLRNLISMSSVIFCCKINWFIQFLANFPYALRMLAHCFLNLDNFLVITGIRNSFPPVSEWNHQPDNFKWFKAIEPIMNCVGPYLKKRAISGTKKRSSLKRILLQRIRKWCFSWFQNPSSSVVFSSAVKHVMYLIAKSVDYIYEGT